VKAEAASAREGTVKSRSVLAAVLLACAALASAQSGVGLGVAVGTTFPQGSTNDIEFDDWQPSLNWGFYVDIPLISTFHVTPSAELYKFGDENATDMALAFKFIVPLTRLDFYAGFVPGLTVTGSTTSPHIGVVAGGALILVSNLDWFVQGKYKFVFEGDENVRVLHLNAGLLFRF
jgi:hypothetical protein